MRGGTGSSSAAATIAAVARGSRRFAVAFLGSRVKEPLLNCGGFRLTRHRGASSHPAPRLKGIGDESTTRRDHDPS